MKPELRWIIPVVVTVVLTMGAGVVAIPWKLDGRYEQKVQAAERHNYVLEQIGGMNRNYLESRIADLEWKLFQLLVAGERRQLTSLEKTQIRSLRRQIERLKNQLSRMR